MELKGTYELKILIQSEKMIKLIVYDVGFRILMGSICM